MNHWCNVVTVELTRNCRNQIEEYKFDKNDYQFLTLIIKNQCRHHQFSTKISDRFVAEEAIYCKTFNYFQDSVGVQYNVSETLFLDYFVTLSHSLRNFPMAIVN